MAAVAELSCTERIGTVAGEIWRLLESNGPMSMSRIVAEMERPRDHVMQGIGWLAREDKLSFEEAQRGITVYVR
ncbi:MAG: winged helix-turn-helix domain-containing protein [Pirellulales bacterium]|nr:winged helix-turn-helix domain-containing protein [Pirellulales bacterium]